MRVTALVGFLCVAACQDSASPAPAATEQPPDTRSTGERTHTAGASSSGAGASLPSSSGAGASLPSSSGAGASLAGAPTAPLGAYPVASSRKTRGGTMTFSNIGAPGWWPRRIDRPAGDKGCTYKDGTDTWGGHCCMKEQFTTSSALSPFDEELTLIVKAVDVKQLAVYQPKLESGAKDWQRVTAWDARRELAENLWFTQQGAGSPKFRGDLTHDDCVGYVMQEPRFDCGDGRDYYCPNDNGILHRGFTGSKLVVLLASMTFPDTNVTACGSTTPGRPAPWVAFVASELVRDGGRKWNGLCNCYSKTGSVGDGCGEINVFEVVMDDNAHSNREFISTGIRSYQAGHIGGAVAPATLLPSDFDAESEVLDACSKRAYTSGPEIVAGGKSDGCPIWRRPTGDRYFFILLDETARTIQVGILHPDNLPDAVRGLLPDLPGQISRATIESLLAMRLPSAAQAS